MQETEDNIHLFFPSLEGRVFEQVSPFLAAGFALPDILAGKLIPGSSRFLRLHPAFLRLGRSKLIITLS
jgi:hypothetical protein